MAMRRLASPVVLDATLTDEKIRELLGFRTEYPELDFKQTLDLSDTKDVVELAKDVGAIEVLGGYIIVGAKSDGTLTGALDHVDLRQFDEANLTPKLLKYLPEPLTLRTRVADIDDHNVVVIYVEAHPDGCAIFRADGQYGEGKDKEVRFREGEVFWRDGTRSRRLTQHGFKEIVARQVEGAKQEWIAEQQAIRRSEREQVEEAYESRRAAAAPLGSVNFDLDRDQLSAAVLELARADDEVAFTRLLIEATTIARALIEAGEVGPELKDLLDKLACLAATLLVYRQAAWFDRVVATFSEIFTLGFGAEPNSTRFGYSTAISPDELGPLVWLTVIERIYLLGALAVRRQDWEAVRTLTAQLPDKVDGYYGTWLRFALTMASRAQHLAERNPTGDVKLSLLTRARAEAGNLTCLRPDGVDDDALLTSLAQFDALANVVAIDAANEPHDAVFYPNFARFRQERIDPVMERLVDDFAMRRALFHGNDAALATALAAIANVAHQVGFATLGFESWNRSPVGAFIQQHLPAA